MRWSLDSRSVGHGRASREITVGLGVALAVLIALLLAAAACEPERTRQPDSPVDAPSPSTATSTASANQDADAFALTAKAGGAALIAGADERSAQRSTARAGSDSLGAAPGDGISSPGASGAGAGGAANLLAARGPVAEAMVSLTATLTAMPPGASSGALEPDERTARTARLAEADRLRGIGLYEEAEQAYMELVADPSEEGRRAAVALARAALQDDDPARALALLSLAAPAGLEALPAAGRYHYGDAAERIYEYSAAAEAYLSYGAAVPAMIDVANLAAGNALFSAGQYSDAHEAFTVARDQAGDESTAYLAALRSGNALLRKGPLAEAVAAYEQAHGLATNDADRSHALAGLIAAHLDAGDDVLAAETRRRLIRELPATSLAPTALERLEASGHPVQPHERAAVLQGAGDHAGALAAYDEAISSEPRAPAAWHLAVIKSHRATGSHSGAIAAADLLLAAEPSDPLAPEAAWLRARSQQSLDMDRSAAESLAALSLTWPGHERAPEALWRRAGIVEMLDGWRAAAEAFDELAERYPGDDQAHEARFRSAFLRLFGGATADAVQRFAALADESDGETRARAHYWLGRIAWDAGDAASAATHWRQAKAADERDYYGLLAADRLGEAPGAALPEPADPELADPERSVAVWLEGWLQGVDADTWDAFRRDVGHRRDVARAAAWLDLGERRAAIRTMDNAVRGSSGDAAGLAALAFEARDLGLHGPSIAAASRVLAAAPPGHEIPAPAALLRLVYPDAFGGLVRDNAAERSVPAALMFALVRAESRFEPTARSSAGATGLTQVMPSTGESIAVWLGETDFETADLYRPETAVRFGAWFLGQQLQQFDSRVPLALAAYNGGPGNAQRWWDEAGGDVDAFAEVIDYSETRKYVRWVTEAQARYELLYGDPR